MDTRFPTTRAETVRAPHLNTVRRILTGLWLALVLCGLALVGYEVASGQWHATPVLSGSMRPGLQPGDVVITHRVPISDLQVRDVIVFPPPDEADRLTVHRIVKLERKGGTTTVTTWGDANTIRDPAVSLLGGTTAYRVTRIVPVLGYPAMWLQNGDHGMLVISLGVILLIVAGGILLRPDKPATPAGLSDSHGDAGELEDATRT
jgi:signal peptidase